MVLCFFLHNKEWVCTLEADSRRTVRLSVATAVGLLLSPLRPQLPVPLGHGEAHGVTAATDHMYTAPPHLSSPSQQNLA